MTRVRAAGGTVSNYAFAVRSIAAVLALFTAVMLASQQADAQVIPDSTKRDTVAVTPVPTVTSPQDTTPRVRRRSAEIRAPLSPRRAFLMSLLVPGLSQARLERTTSGALFAGVEMASLAMLRRSAADVRDARRQDARPIPGDFVVNRTTGELTPRLPIEPRYDEALVRTRKLHVEDWMAALAFNHLIAGADAFVSAQLWDVPTRVALVPTRQGMMLAATIQF